MIDDTERHEVQVPLAAGHSVRRVGHMAGLPKSRVHRIAREEPVADAGEKRLRVVRGAGRPSEVARFRAHVLAMLQEKPDLLSAEVLRRLREINFPGSYPRPELNPAVAEFERLSCDEAWALVPNPL